MEKRHNKPPRRAHTLHLDQEFLYLSSTLKGLKQSGYAGMPFAPLQSCSVPVDMRNRYRHFCIFGRQTGSLLWDVLFLPAVSSSLFPGRSRSHILAWPQASGHFPSCWEVLRPVIIPSLCSFSPADGCWLHSGTFAFPSEFVSAPLQSLLAQSRDSVSKGLSEGLSC